MTSVDQDLTCIDEYCGLGGESVGLTRAGFNVVLAINHWDRAIQSHSANFPDTEHWCTDTQTLDMRRLRRARVLWASPICTESSPAGGQKRSRTAAGQGELELEGPVAAPAMERTRTTFYDVLRSVEVWAYDAVMIENVVDVATVWPLFDWWLEAMKRLSYNVQFVSVSTAHIGGDGIPYAPQWRDRLFLVFTRTGIPLPDVEPRPLAWCPECREDTHALQSWKKPGRRIGKYRQQYRYVCERTTCRHAVVEPYVSPAAAAIDWSDLGVLIGDKKPQKRYGGLPLAPKTMARIQAGIDEFARPIVAQAAGNTFERYPGMRTVPADRAPLGALTTTAEKAVACPPVMLAVNHDGADARAYPAHQAPLPARTVKIGDGMVCPPMLSPAGGTWRDRAESVDVPMGARTTRETDGLVCPPFMAELWGTSTARPVVDEPLAAVTAGGGHHGLTVPPGSFYVRNYGHTDPRYLVGDAARDPLGVITAKDHHSLVVPYYRTGRTKHTGQPLDTITTHDRFALVDGDLEHSGIDINDCSFRMLKPREQANGQGFPVNYIIHGNKGEQTMLAGNAVSCNVAQWLGGRVRDVLERVA